MSRALVRTWLPIEKWREYFGINPLHFHQAYSSKFVANCGDVWFQYSWQQPDQAGRHELAEAIHSAEKAITDQIGYNLIPDWTTQEVVRLPRPARRDVYFADMSNIRLQGRSVELPRGYILQAGYRVKQTLSAGVAIARADNDGDGYKEDCTVTLATTVTEPCEIRIYFPGHDGEDEWEIRPASVEIAGGLASITFKSWLIFDPDLEEVMNAAAIDGDDDSKYITTVDVYRVYTDTSTQAQLLWEPDSINCCNASSCIACQIGTQDACLTIRDGELGYVVAQPASYADGVWSSVALATCRAPDKIRAYYLSGWQDPQAACPGKDMDRYWMEAVCRYSAALLDRDVCSCNNSERFIGELRRDIAAVRQGIVFQTSTDSQIANPFGTWVGALFAWSRVNAKGRALPK